MGTLVASFRFDVRGMSLTEPIECATNQHSIILSVVDPQGSELRLAITLEADSEQAALQLSQAIADKVYERMLLELTPHVAGSARPIHERHTFTAEGGATAVGLSAGTSAVIAHGVAVLDPAMVKPALDRALSDVEAGPLAASAMVSARAMFRVAMQTNDPVASYLICYSALHLAAQLKGGPSAKYQSNVDALLIAEDPSIKIVSVSLPDGSTKQESPLTTLRNRFVHAEDRGKDPEGAAREMRDRLPALRDLTARILRRL